jgi:hypothetical protein
MDGEGVKVLRFRVATGIPENAIYIGRANSGDVLLGQYLLSEESA